MLNAVETPERDWTDSRIDDLKESVDKGFAEAKADNKDLRKEMKDGFATVEKQFEQVDAKMDAGFAKADEKMDAGFAKADAKLGINIREVRKEMKEGFSRVDKQFERLDEKFDRKFDRLMWGLVVVASGAVPALLGVIGSLIQSQIS